ncbi:unnamed protein product, partial [Iphiclides podalirius]
MMIGETRNRSAVSVHAVGAGRDEGQVRQEWRGSTVIPSTDQLSPSTRCPVHAVGADRNERQVMQERRVLTVIPSTDQLSPSTRSGQTGTSVK